MIAETMVIRQIEVPEAAAITIVMPSQINLWDGRAGPRLRSSREPRVQFPGKTEYRRCARSSRSTRRRALLASSRTHPSRLQQKLESAPPYPFQGRPPPPEPTLHPP